MDCDTSDFHLEPAGDFFRQNMRAEFELPPELRLGFNFFNIQPIVTLPGPKTKRPSHTQLRSRVGAPVRVKRARGDEQRVQEGTPYPTRGFIIELSSIRSKFEHRG